MTDSIQFDYFYGKEADQFSFIRIPVALVKDPIYKGLSSDAKLLYGLMLSRMSLSQKNGWVDDKNRVYIIYTIEDVMEDLGRSNGTCSKIIAELDSQKGIGLIERKRRGLGKPDIIYVKNFIINDSENQQDSPSDNPSDTPSTSTSSPEMQNLHFKTFNNCISENANNEFPEMQDSNANYSNANYIEPTNKKSIYQSQNISNSKMDEMESVNAYINLIKENIDYDQYMQSLSYQEKECFMQLFKIICDVVTIPRNAIRIGKGLIPYELVKSRFLELNGFHLEYVMDCMSKTTSSIKDIKSYLTTALFNAPTTMDYHYTQKVQHDTMERMSK